MSHSVRTFIAAAVCALALGLTGCVQATTQPAKKGSVTKKKVKCIRDAPTGSHITQMVCYTDKDVKERRQNDREKVRNMQIGGAVVPTNTGH